MVKWHQVDWNSLDLKMKVPDLLIIADGTQYLWGTIFLILGFRIVYVVGALYKCFSPPHGDTKTDLCYLQMKHAKLLVARWFNSAIVFEWSKIMSSQTI